MPISTRFYPAVALHEIGSASIRVIGVWLDGWDGDWPMWHDEKCQMGARIRSPAPWGGVPRRALDGLGRWTGERSVSRVWCPIHPLRLDLTAVRNAITETWSNGQTEGQINRLKLLKRAMYGRAGVDLLRARMIPLSPSHAN